MTQVLSYMEAKNQLDLMVDRLGNMLGTKTITILQDTEPANIKLLISDLKVVIDRHK